MSGALPGAMVSGICWMACWSLSNCSLIRMRSGTAFCGTGCSEDMPKVSKPTTSSM